MPGLGSLLAADELERSLADYWQKKKKKICRPKQVEKNIIDFSPRLLFILLAFSVRAPCLCLRTQEACLRMFWGRLGLSGRGMPLIVATKEPRDTSPSVSATDLRRLRRRQTGGVCIVNSLWGTVCVPCGFSGPCEMETH